jgi:hypothetical protein
LVSNHFEPRLYFEIRERHSTNAPTITGMKLVRSSDSPCINGKMIKPQAKKPAKTGAR